MDLQQIYYVGEFFGVVAVVASLLFVGVQMRQNTWATRATSHHAITDAINQINLAIAQNPDLAQRDVGVDLVMGRPAADDLTRFRLARFSDGTKMKPGPGL